jgi:hypothetical protein
MSGGRDRTIYRRDNGKWINKRDDREQATGVHDTQQEAIDEGRENLHNQGDGKLITKGRDGKIRSKETISLGNDPYPPKDTER